MDVNTCKLCGKRYVSLENYKLHLTCTSPQISEHIAKLDEIYTYSFEKEVSLDFCAPTFNVFPMPNLPPSVDISLLSYRLSVYLRIIIGSEKVEAIPRHALYATCCHLLLLQAALHWPLLNHVVRKYVRESRTSTRYDLSATVFTHFFEAFHQLAGKIDALQPDKTEIQLMHAMLVVNRDEGSSRESYDANALLAQYENRKHGLGGAGRSAKVKKIFFRVVSLVEETGVSRLTAPLNAQFSEFPVHPWDMHILTSVLYFNESRS